MQLSPCYKGLDKRIDQCHISDHRFLMHFNFLKYQEKSKPTRFINITLLFDTSKDDTRLWQGLDQFRTSYCLYIPVYPCITSRKS